jgi:hypothetical protein
VCSNESPRGVDHDIVLATAWFTLSDQAAFSIRGASLGTSIVMSLPSGTAPTVTVPKLRSRYVEG